MQEAGRSDRERAGQLADVVRGVVSQHHEAVLVSGPPGWGTSTFLDGIAAGVRSAGWRVAAAEGSSAHRSMPYATILDLLRDLVGTAPSASRLTDGIPDLHRLIGGARPAAHQLPTQPGLERTRLASAIRQVVQRVAATGRVLVVIDDLQDVDEVSLEILSFVMTDRQSPRIAFVLGLRADHGATHPAGVISLSTYAARLQPGTRVDLRPLTRSEVAAQLAGILSGPPPESLTTLAHGLSGGSPGLVRLLVAELRRRGVLAQRAGVWLLGPVDDLTVPAGAEPMLVAMLTGVDEVARCAVELLSAGDGEVPATALCRVCCRGPAAMEAALQVLADRGLVREDLRPEGHAVRGTVPLLQRLVAQALGPQRLQELRAAVNRASLSDAIASGVPDGGSALCEGWPLSDIDAFELLRRGVDGALTARSWREAVTLAEVGIRRAAALAAYDQMAGLHEARARGLHAGGHRSDAVAAWSASVLATPMVDVGRRADRLRELAEVEWQESLFAAASGHIEEAAALVKTDPAAAGTIRDAVTLTRGLFAGRAPMPTPAQDVAVADLDALWRRTGLPAAGVARLIVLTDAAARDGRWAQMLDQARQACRLAATSGDPRLVGQAAVSLETAQVVAMDVGARDAIAVAISSAADAELEAVEADHRSLAAFLQVMAGDIAGGLAHADAILAIGSRLGSRSVLAKGFLVRGLIHAYVGDTRLALACQEEFLGCYDNENASLLHLNVGAGELAAHIALRQGRLADVLSALDAVGNPRRGHWFHASMLAGSAHFGLGDRHALAAQVAALRALPEPMPWVEAVIDRLEGLRLILAGDQEAAGLLQASSLRLEELGLALPAAAGWLEWADLGLAGRLDADASARVESAASELARMGAHEAAERGRRLLRGPRRRASAPGRPGELTEREREVALLVAEGLSNPEIADRLFVSTRTVTTHLTHIYARLGLSGRTALARYMHTGGATEAPGL
ncbi:MAG TPA: AAA family ATPase [Tetrasphaera sp.]|uniref:ATP-binding protein n=1 Tax=Nostocoides sp. TaxID=1917966 RepID=UPI002C6D9F2B|nr:AAA family ATPase [Tetrasphaera sp.]HNQ07432.1 AAA family ATPase [Tetrasphaera sp.]